MRLRLILITVLMTMLMMACQSGPPPTMFVMQVTVEVPVTVIVTAVPGGEATAEPVALATEDPAATTTGTPTPTPTATPDVFPTPVVGQVYVAEQPFQNGRLFWLQPVDQIWLLTTNAEGERVWSVYEDTFVEGQIERDPTITPPAGLYQPERGFGKLWRDNMDVQTRLGWALEPEIGYITRYEYRAGGIVTEDNEYIPGEGYHIIETLNREIIRFNEADRSWEVSVLGE